jgi:polyisoprenoid-binding protein YceI
MQMTATNWDFDKSHSGIHFTVRHLMVSKVRGAFHDWSGTLALDDEDITRSKVAVTIQAASVDTKEAKRDEHLRSADFFEAEKYPTLEFRSTAVKQAGTDELEVTGDLTIHGITKSVVLHVEVGGQVKDPWGGTRAGFSAKTSISRKDYGLTWNGVLEAGGVVVGDKIEISLEIEAIKKAAAKAA